MRAFEEDESGNEATTKPLGQPKANSNTTDKCSNTNYSSVSMSGARNCLC